MACGGMIFTKNLKFWRKKVLFILLKLIYLCHYCSKNLKGSRNIPGFALIREVFYNFMVELEDFNIISVSPSFA